MGNINPLRHMTGDKLMSTQMTTLNVGDRIRLDGGRKAWRVQAVSPNFAVCVQQADFQPKGTLCYTVLDWRNGVRGPCNLIGQGYGDGSYGEAQCAEMLTAFEFDYHADPPFLAAMEAGEKSWAPTMFALEVSHRNRVTIESVEPIGEGEGTDGEH